MAKPLFLIENVFNVVQFSTHAVTANEEAAGFEATKVGRNRRSAANRWEPTTANQDSWLAVDMGAARNVDTLIVDRGHNLSGETVKLQKSTDDFVGDTTDIFSVTAPSAVPSGGDVTSSPGVLTEEGAWIFRFGTHSTRYLRLFVSAMGAGLRPKIVGLYAGLAWEPSEFLDQPFGWGDRDVMYDEQVSDVGWSAVRRPAERRRTSLGLKLADAAEYATVRAGLETHFLRAGRPMWIVHDQAFGERAWLGRAPPGAQGFQQRRGWFHQQAVIEAVEHEPSLT